MKKTNKKGFTIVELVIVIAVIAILAAVLIPTFGGVIDKAKTSANDQDAANTYKQLLTTEKYLGDLDLAAGDVADLYIVVGSGEDEKVYEVVDGKITVTAMAKTDIKNADNAAAGEAYYAPATAEGYSNAYVYVTTKPAANP